MRISELAGKEIIEVGQARSLGTITDPEVEIDTETGRVVSIVIPGRRRGLLPLWREPDLMIPWSRVKTIGPEIVLVEMPESEYGNAPLG